LALTLIDLHSHILPALDDGPRTIEESLDLARSAVADGVGILACTPHNQKHLSRPVIEAAVKELRAALAAAGIPLRLALGVEVLLEADMDALIAEERAFCLHNTRYMLIELPFDFWPPFTEQALFDLQLRGIVPIIAHPDRYRAVQTDPNRLVPLIERGALAQLTAGSLLGDFGPGPQRCAEALLKQNLV
jgi:protein-tyrosine phosphatase